MTRKIHYFNMIEVLLALTVIAIGMTSIMGLFPVGLKASRQAVAENSSANVADQMVTYLRVISEINQAQYAKAFYDNGSNDTFVDSTGVVISNGEFTVNPIGSANEREVDDNSLNFLKAYTIEKIDDSGTDKNKLEAGTIDFERVASGWAVFKVDGVTNQPRVFFIVQGHNCTENDVSGDRIFRTVDYSAMALVWKETVQIKRLESDGVTWSLWPDLSGSPTEFTKYEFSGKLNVELSWPLELPYSQRKKRYYQVVINKP